MYEEIGIAMTMGMTVHSIQLSQSIGIPKANLEENEKVKVKTIAMTVTTTAFGRTTLYRSIALN
ncbi:conserved protein of unknown function [Aminobacter niigataensis]|nr:conserved protein of unknown function [Aminobacter niigataensis]